VLLTVYDASNAVVVCCLKRRRYLVNLEMFWHLRPSAFSSWNRVREAHLVFRVQEGRPVFRVRDARLVFRVRDACLVFRVQDARLA
jgi:hypothetical protein